MRIEPSPWTNFEVPVDAAAARKAISSGNIDKAIDQIRDVLLEAGWELDTESGIGHGHAETHFSHFPTMDPPDPDEPIVKRPLHYPVRVWLDVIIIDPTWPRSDDDGLVAARFVSVKHFCFFDPFREEPRTSDAWVAMGSSQAASATNLLLAVQTAYPELVFGLGGGVLTISAQVPGTKYSNYIFTGNTGTPGGIAQGGWHLKSPAQIECVVAKSYQNQIYWGFFFGGLTGGQNDVETGLATGPYGRWYFKIEMPQEAWMDTTEGRRYRALNFTVLATEAQVIYLSGNGNLNDGPPAPDPNYEANIQGRFFPTGCFIVSRPWVPDEVTDPRYVVVAGQFPVNLDWNSTTRFYVPGGFPHTTSWYTDALAGPMVLRSVQVPVTAPSGEPVISHAMLMMAPDQDGQSAIIGKLWNSVVFHDFIPASSGVSSDFQRWFENAGGTFHLYSTGGGRFYDIPVGSLFFFVPAA